MTPTIDVRDERQPGHFWADNEVYTRFGPLIGIDGFAVYMALCQYANKDAEAWPSVPTLAKQLDAAPNTIRKALVKLKDAGLISITERPRDASRKVAQTNVYTLLRIDKREGTSSGEVPQDMKYGVLHDVKGGTSPDEGGVLHDVKGNKTNKNKTQGISGGDTREREATPPPQDPIVVTLVRCGLTPGQAIEALALHGYTSDELAALETWAERLRKKKVKPGAVLWGYAKRGLLPEDIPKPQKKRAEPRLANGQVDYHALSDLIANDPSYYRRSHE